MSQPSIYPNRPFARTARAIAGSAALLLASSAWAAPGVHKDPIAIAEVEARTQARFQTMDSNGDSVISLPEFEAAEPLHHHKKHADRQHRGGQGPMPGKGAMQRGKGEHRAQMRAAVEAEMFTILDSNGDGQLSRDEHAAGSERTNRKLARQRAMFKHLDQDGNGELTMEEMPSRVERLTAADADGDGSVTREEMRAYRQARKQAQAG